MDEKRKPEKLIPPHGGYRNLKSFQVAQLVYDVTVRFCDKYTDKRSRTKDQMVQAARSGVQNIAEGSQASGTSKKTELKLTNVARASLEELKLDYEDFLRQGGLPMWERNDTRRQALIDARAKTADEVAEWAKAVKAGWFGEGIVGQKPEQSGHCGQSGRRGHERSSGGPIESTRSTGSTASTPGYAEISANGALALTVVACELLSRQIASLERAFVEEGGFTERLYRVRTAARNSRK